MNIQNWDFLMDPTSPVDSFLILTVFFLSCFKAQCSRDLKLQFENTESSRSETPCCHRVHVPHLLITLGLLILIGAHYLNLELNVIS